MATEGVRIKSKVLKNADLKDIERFFRDSGFQVSKVIRTARYVTILIRVDFNKKDSLQEKCCWYDAEIKIGDNGVVFRWKGVAPKRYYHLDSDHKDEANALAANAAAFWARYEDKVSKQLTD